MVGQGILLRPASPNDVAELARFARASFAATYAPTHDAARIRVHCETALSEPAFEAALAQADGGILLALRDLRVIGFAQVQPAAAPVPAARPLELKRFYVDASEHGRGLAQALIDTVIAYARDRSTDLLWLCVYPGNARAQRFYARQGFEAIGRVPFTFVDLTEEDLALGLRLAGDAGQSGDAPLYSPPSR